VIVFFSICFGYEGAKDSCSSAMNHSIFQKAVFVRNNSGASLYQMPEVSPPLNIIHLWGSPYEMGFAHGSLMKKEIQQMYEFMYDWIDAQMQPYIDSLPEWLQKILEEIGIEGALEATYLLTRPYIPDHWLEELQGLADGAGVSFSTVIQVHMFPELIQAQCTMVGAWGPASKTGSLYQLRALDWSTDGPFQQLPAVYIFHPNADDGHTFSIVSWVGFVAGLSGYSSVSLALSQKVWDGYNGEFSRHGYPWHFLLRDILQYDADVNSGLSRIATAARTCAIFVGLGDPHNNFRAIEYAYDNVTVYDDMNFPAWPNHFRAPGIVYVDKHVQPSSDPCPGSVLSSNYGKIDSMTFINQLVPMHQTGDMHIVVYDFANATMYVANASPSVNGKVTPAYYRPFSQLDMTKLFSEPRPVS